MKIIYFILASIISISCAGQQNLDSSGNIFLFSSIGVSYLQKNADPSFSHSIQTSTGIGSKLSPHSSFALALSFDSYGYKKSGANYNIDGNLRTTDLAVLYKYVFGTKICQPYIKAGLGSAFLSVPTVIVSQNAANFKNEMETLLFFLGETGVQVRVFNRYSIFLGAEQKWISKSNLINAISLRATSVKFGLISSF